MICCGPLIGGLVVNKKWHPPEPFFNFLTDSETMSPDAALDD